MIHEQVDNSPNGALAPVPTSRAGGSSMELNLHRMIQAQQSVARVLMFPLWQTKQPQRSQIRRMLHQIYSARLTRERRLDEEHDEWSDGDGDEDVKTLTSLPGVAHSNIRRWPFVSCSQLSTLYRGIAVPGLSRTAKST